jgi:LPS O-antigen subunit length determinant protein (WzzB/FepE family)
MTNEIQESQDEETSLLDLLLVLAQNLRLLIVGPLIAGLLAFGLSWLLIPVKFESVAVQSADAQLAAMYNTTGVLDGVVQTMGYAKAGEDTDTARERLLEKDYSIKFNLKDKTVRIAARADTPQNAQRMAQTAIQLATKLNQSRVDEIQRLKSQFELATSRERSYADAAQRVAAQIQASPTSAQAALVDSQRNLLDSARGAQALAADLSEKIRQAADFELLQKPTLPVRKVAAGRTVIAALSVLAVGFFLLAFVLVVHLSRQTKGADAERLVQLRAALKKSLLGKS